MKVLVVASNNPVKLNSASNAFKSMFPEEKLEIKAVSVPSEVSEQPMSDDETYKGAINRAKNAKLEIKEADYWVGIEGGCEETKRGLEAFAWVAVLDNNEKIGVSRTSIFVLPDKIAELVRNGMELGQADDLVFGNTNSKQKHGTVGALTDNSVDRTEYYTQAAILAFIPFKNPKLY